MIHRSRPLSGRFGGMDWPTPNLRGSMHYLRPSRWVTLLVLVLLPGCQRSAAGAPQAQPPPRTPAPTAQSTLLPVPPPSLARMTESGQNPGAIADVVERVLPSVVSISSTRIRKMGPGTPFDDPFFKFFFGPQQRQPRERKEQGLGSGVVVGEGIVVTNNHLVEEADEIKITTYDHHELQAELVGTDPKSDLAVLRVKANPDVLRPLAMGDSTRLRLGDVVLAIGNPFGLGQTVTMGIVSAKGRADVGIVDYEDFIQTDAAINPGNSGGALVDSQGNLVGINTAILSRSGGNMGIGFAIPTAMARPIVDSLLSEGKVVRGWLGVMIQNLEPDLARALDVQASAGVLVTGVQKGSPAERGGLQRGDLVLSVNDRPVTSPGELRNAIAAAGANRTVKLDIERQKKRMSLSVPLGTMPDEEASASPGSKPSPTGKAKPNDFGMTLEPLNPTLRKRLDVPDEITEGVVVTDLSSDSDAAKSGILPGDLILELGRQKIRSVADLERAWRATKGPIPALLWRRGMTNYVVIKR